MKKVCQKLEDKAGFKPMFYSWTKIEDFVREENPELSNIEFDEIMDGFRAHEKLVNMHLIDRLNKSKSDSSSEKSKSLINLLALNLLPDKK